MRELVFVKPGQVEWREAAAPQLQGDDEALVRPLAVARCDLDLGIVSGTFPVPGPFALGHEFVAEIAELGGGVRGFEVGQRVVVPFQISCGECPPCRRGLTNSCQSVQKYSMYGFGPRGGPWGGALSDLVRVPFASHMLVSLPGGMEPADVASISDNVIDGWRTVGPPLEAEPGAEVLVVGGGALSVGMYAVAAARTLGAAAVHYVDKNEKRRQMAEALGAVTYPFPTEERLGPFPITVDASANTYGLDLALKAVAPGGICTSVGIYISPTVPIPLRSMYDRGVTFTTSRVTSRAHLPKVLGLVQEGRLKPEAVTTLVADWEDAPEAIKDPGVKVVFNRTNAAA